MDFKRSYAFVPSACTILGSLSLQRITNVKSSAQSADSGIVSKYDRTAARR